jgi:hypothetical protein
MGETDSADKFMVFCRGTSPICSYWNNEKNMNYKLVNHKLLSKKLMVKCEPIEELLIYQKIFLEEL